jgi:hypothetical protein
MLALLLEAALRSLALGGIVWLGLKLLRVRDPRVHMTAWMVVLVASLSMLMIMRWVTLTLPSAAPPLRLAEIIWAHPDQPLEAVQTEALQTAEGFSPVPSAPALEPNPAQAHRNATSTTPDRRIERWVD